MWKIDNPTTVDVMPPQDVTIKPGFFTKGGQGQAPTNLSADFFNVLISEFINLLADVGISPKQDDLEQIKQAVIAIAKRESNTAGDGVYLKISKNLADITDAVIARKSLDVNSKAEGITEISRALINHHSDPDAHDSTKIKSVNGPAGDNVSEQLIALSHDIVNRSATEIPQSLSVFGFTDAVKSFSDKLQVGAYVGVKYVSSFGLYTVTDKPSGNDIDIGNGKALTSKLELKETGIETQLITPASEIENIWGSGIFVLTLKNDNASYGVTVVLDVDVSKLNEDGYVVQSTVNIGNSSNEILVTVDYRSSTNSVYPNHFVITNASGLPVKIIEIKKLT